MSPKSTAAKTIENLLASCASPTATALMFTELP
jgi:hypothetical protein